MLLDKKELSVFMLTIILSNYQKWSKHSLNLILRTNDTLEKKTHNIINTQVW